MNGWSRVPQAAWRSLLAAAMVLTLVTTAVPAGAVPPTPEESGEPQLAPLSPEFLDYPEEPPEVSYGYVPPPFDLSHLDELAGPEVDVQALPSRYDWRDQGKVTSVKNQKRCGMCWAFGSTSVLESAVLIGEGATHDFSEQSVGLCVDRSWTYLYEQPEDPCQAGGWSWLASEVFIKKGAVSETCNPYDTSALRCDGWCVCDTCPAVKMVDGYRFVTDDGSQIARIKNAVHEHGPVTVVYFNDPDYYYSDPTWGTIYDYYPSPDETSHLVSIVGWDDNVPHPNPSHTGTGAWIAKNSWGTGWGDNGYFYLTYDSSNARHVAYLQYKDPDPTEELLYWDEAGKVTAIGYKQDTAWMASVFTAPQGKALTHVDFWTTSSNAAYEIYIWQGSFGSQLAHQTGSSQEFGYYSIPLSTPIAIPGGQQFTVGVKMTTPGYNSPIPIEYEIPGWVNPPIQANVSFIRPTADYAWSDLAKYDYNASLRARMWAVGAASRTWTGNISSNWHMAGNWTPSGVPTSSDDVTIPNMANDPIISSADAQANNLTINAGAVLDVTDRALTVEGTLTNNGTLKQTQGVTQGSTTNFLRITNLAGTQTKYWGVDVTPTDITSSAGLPELMLGLATEIRSKLQGDGQSGSSAWSGGRIFEKATPTTSEVEDPMRRAGDRILYSMTDADVLETYASDNSGDFEDMWAGYDGGLLDSPGQIARSLVRFNIAALPPGQGITEATLWLYMGLSWDIPDPTRTIRMYRATSAWFEETVTWNSKPGFAESYGSTSIVHADWGWYELDLTDLVRAWYEGTYTNHGIMIRADQESVWGFRAFGTRESDFAPELAVAYQPPPSNSPPHQPHAPSPAHGAINQSVDVDLTRTGGDPDVDDTVTYNIYFGTNPPPPFRASVGPFPASQTSLSYDPGPLAQGTQYFWRVVATDNHGASTTGSTWSFTTGTVGTRVTVSVSGNQRCAGRDTGVQRCCDVSPEANMDATVRFYFKEAERSGLALQDLLVFHYVGQWTEEPGPYTRGGAGKAQYVQAQNVGDFSLFALDTPDDEPAPTVTSITPNSGHNTGSVSVSIAGTGFQTGASVKLTRAGYADINGTGVAVVNPSQITCSFNLLGKAAGSWTVVVTNPDTQSGTLPNGFTVTSPPPTVTSITPNSRENTGSLSVSIAGTGFQTGASVKLTRAGYAAINGTSVAVVSPSQITCNLNLTGKAAGWWNVVVTNLDAQSGTLPNGFTITAPPSFEVFLPLMLRRWSPVADDQFARPGLWTGTYQSSFTVTTDNKVRDFSVTLPIPRPEGGQCEISLTEQASIEDRHFSLGIVQGALKFIEGDFITPTTLTGIFHSVSCENTIWFYEEPLDWETSWKQP